MGCGGVAGAGSVGWDECESCAVGSQYMREIMGR